MDIYSELISKMKDKATECFIDTPYESYIDEIVRSYSLYLKLVVETGLVKEEDLKMFEIKKVVFEHGNAYASWSMGTLTFNERFFDINERTEEERRNVLFHEFTHSITNGIILENDRTSSLCSNFFNIAQVVNEYMSDEELLSIRNRFEHIFEGAYYNRNNNLISCKMFFDEVSTQWIAEKLTALSYGREMDEMVEFDSKVLDRTPDLKTNFATYPEFEQVFLNFLRTINGFGNIMEDDKLFDKWFRMLRDGSIWQVIVGTYKEQGRMADLYEILITFNALFLAQSSAMGVGNTYNGSKELLTKNIIYLDKKLVSLRNLDPEKDFEYEEFPKPPTLVGFKITPRK